jgi:hypothetical protein
MIRIENWRLISHYGVPAAPETSNYRLEGIVTGHPRKDDGKEVITSPIVDGQWKNGIVYTRSGHEYHLGKPDPQWVAWLREHTYDKSLGWISFLLDKKKEK